MRVCCQLLEAEPEKGFQSGMDSVRANCRRADLKRDMSKFRWHVSDLKGADTPHIDAKQAVRPQGAGVKGLFELKFAA